MKRFLALMLVCLTLALCVVACKKDETDTSDTEATGSVEESVIETPETDAEAEGEERTLKLSGTVRGVHVFGKRVYVNRNYLACDYSGSGMEFVVNFNGGKLYVRTKTDAPCKFVVTVDGTVKKFNGEQFVLIDGDEDIAISGMTKGKHTVKIIKLTGYEQARASFFNLRFHGSLISDEAAPDADIFVEYLGGSAASGIGSIGDYTDQNATQAYPYLLSESLKTEYSIFALSDGDLMKKVSDAYPYASVKRDAKTLYDFENKADVTVVHVGSEGKNADEFSASYRSLLEMIREKNGKACRIVCVYNSSDSVAASSITAICGELGGEAAGIYAIAVSVKDGGAMSAQEQKALADAISATLDKAIKTEIDFGNVGADDEVGDPDIKIDHNDPAWNKQD